MVEKKKSFGSKKSGFKPRTGEGKRSFEGRSGSSNYRAPQPRKAGVPTGAVIAIAAPCVAIIFVLFFGSSIWKRDPKVVVNDPNTRIKVLEGKVKLFQAEYRKVRKLMVEDSSNAEASADRLINRMQDWLVEWNEEMSPYQDAEGYLKKDFKGYSKTRSDISRLIYDLSKSKGF